MASGLTAATQQSLGVSARGNLINCWFLVDNSGSMAGEKWKLAQAGVANCVSQLTDVDFMGVLVFGSQIKSLASGMKRDTSLGPFHAASADGGGTALYDAIIQGGSLALAIHNQLIGAMRGQGIHVITYVVLLTDGEDTSSKKTQQDVRQFLAMINQVQDFKYVLAGVGLSGAASSIMRSFGAIGDRDIEFRELRTTNDIRELFEHVTIQLTQTRHVLVMGQQGAVFVEQQTAVNLHNGQVTQATRGVVATGNTPPRSGGVRTIENPLISKGGQPSYAPRSNQVALVPTAIVHFWDPEYDLNDYEKQALAGTLCCMPFCTDCCVPGTVDTLCLRYPSCTIGNCKTGNVCLGTCMCFFPVQVVCCPVYACLLCGHCCGGNRYEA